MLTRLNLFSVFLSYSILIKAVSSGCVTSAGTTTCTYAPGNRIANAFAKGRVFDILLFKVPGLSMLPETLPLVSK